MNPAICPLTVCQETQGGNTEVATDEFKGKFQDLAAELHRKENELASVEEAYDMLEGHVEALELEQQQHLDQIELQKLHELATIRRNIFRDYFDLSITDGDSDGVLSDGQQV